MCFIHHNMTKVSFLILRTVQDYILLQCHKAFVLKYFYLKIHIQLKLFSFTQRKQRLVISLFFPISNYDMIPGYLPDTTGQPATKSEFLWSSYMTKFRLDGNLSCSEYSAEATTTILISSYCVILPRIKESRSCIYIF